MARGVIPSTRRLGNYKMTSLKFLVFFPPSSFVLYLLHDTLQLRVYDREDKKGGSDMGCCCSCRQCNIERSFKRIGSATKEKRKMVGAASSKRGGGEKITTNVVCAFFSRWSSVETAASCRSVSRVSMFLTGLEFHSTANEAAATWKQHFTHSVHNSLFLFFFISQGLISSPYPPTFSFHSARSSRIESGFRLFNVPSRCWTTFDFLLWRCSVVKRGGGHMRVHASTFFNTVYISFFFLSTEQTKKKNLKREKK